MRILELTAHVKTISRAQGRSATSAAAYRACTRITCQREGRVHDYRRKGGLEASAMVAPDIAPAWARDRSGLWNGAELRERNGARGRNAGAFKADATTAREVVFGFPVELSPAGRLTLAHEVARHLVEAHGVAVDFSLHAPGKMGDQRNHHCHMMFTTRRMSADGLADKTREWDDRSAGPRTVRDFRAYLAGAMNTALATEGQGAAVHVEHRSHKERGTGIVPTKHQGPGRTNAARVRKARERQAWERQHRAGQADQHGRDRAELKARQDAAAAARHRDIDERERRAVDRARPAAPIQEATRQPAAAPARGLTRLFQAITGRTEHQPPAQPGPDQARQPPRLDELRAAFHAEREQVRTDHARETCSLDDRHRSEDQQLDRAAGSRADRDRSEEVHARRDQAEGRIREHTHERAHDRERHHEQDRSMKPG